MQNKKARKKLIQWVEGKSVIITTLVIGVILLLLAAFLPIPNFFIIIRLKDIGSENGLTLYLSQLSFTFITISVMSVLSDSSNIIYWENIVDRKLIQPKWYCFYAYTTYSFATVLFGGLASLFDFSLLFMLFFALDVLILMALTFSMIDVYFRHGEKAEMLEREFVKLSTNPDDGFKRWDKDRAEYRRITNGLKTNTVLAFRNYDVSTIYENLGFYARNAQYIPESDFYVLFKCVDEININDFLTFVEEYAYYGINDRTYSDANLNSISELMTRGTSLFSVIFDEKIFPKFAQSMDGNAAERLFYAYRQYLIRTRNAMKTTNPEYDRKTNGPATFYCRYVLQKTLMREAMAQRNYILNAFVRAFADTNVITNYGDNLDDKFMWECFVDELPADHEVAESIFYSLSDVNEIMYGDSCPEFLDEVIKYNPTGKTKAEFSSDSNYETEWSVIHVDEGELLADDSDEDDGYLDLEEDDVSDIHFDDDGIPEVLPGEWPPESDHTGFYTYEGRRNYSRSAQWGRINDGDIDSKDW